MKKAIKNISLGLAVFTVFNAASQSNTPCNGSGAPFISVNSSCTYTASTSVGSVNNQNATNFGTMNCGSPGPDVWYAFTAPASGQVLIQTQAGTTTDLVMAVYESDCSTYSTELSCDDDSGPGAMPEILQGGLNPTQTYFIRMWDYGGGTGTFDVCVTEVSTTPPANDDCTDAIGLTVNADLNCGTVTAGSVLNATGSPDPTAETCFGTPDDDVWYSFVATQSTHQISLLNVTGSTTDMYHSVYEEGPGCPGLGTEIICSDADISNLAGLTPGVTYYVRVYTYTGTGGQTSNFDICVGTPEPPPVNVDCGSMEPICTDSGLDFTAQSGGPDADVVDPGNNYGCLSSQPNPTWFYFEISNAGNLQFDMSAGSDIDYAVWGPYANLAAAQADCGSMPAPIDCSFSTSATETANITGAQVGEVYVLLITNYANVTQQITATQTGGTATTDCTIVTCPGADAGSW